LENHPPYYVCGGRKTYAPPNETIEDYMKRYQDMTMMSSEKEVRVAPVEESTEGEKRDMCAI
jgi:hypothetical protein